MKSPGMLLTEAREERGLTLDDVAAMTRIPKGMLEHLENDRFEEYVAEVFARGHLRNYARELRLDPDKVLQSYERHTGRRRIDPLADAEQGGGRKPSTTTPVMRSSVSGDSSVAASQDTGGFKKQLGGLRGSHLVAAILVIVGLFMMFGYLSNNRATAQDPADYQEVEESNWELEQDVEQTRWLLEQSVIEEE